MRQHRRVPSLRRRRGAPRASGGEGNHKLSWLGLPLAGSRLSSARPARRGAEARQSRPWEALSTYRRARPGPRAPHHRDDHVSRDGHALLAGAGGGWDGAGAVAPSVLRCAWCATPIADGTRRYGFFAVAYHVAGWDAFVEAKVITRGEGPGRPAARTLNVGPWLPRGHARAWLRRRKDRHLRGAHADGNLNGVVSSDRRSCAA
jgi:hypothetical protein